MSKDSFTSEQHLPMALPDCPNSPDHGQLHLRDPKRLTKEQAWCGVWYDCGQCHASVLFQGVELAAYLTSFGGVHVPDSRTSNENLARLALLKGDLGNNLTVRERNLLQDAVDALRPHELAS